MDGEEVSKNKLSYIFGRKMKDQAKLLRRARKESSKWRTVQLDRTHYQYFFVFFKKHFLLIISLMALLFSQGLIEAGLVIFSRDYLSNENRVWLADHFLFLFLGLIAVFLINSFFSIKYERSLVVLLTNSIRRRLFKSHIARPLESHSSERQANLVAKISYHLPLASLGVSNVFFGIWRWLLYFGVIISICIIAGYHVPLIGLCFVGVSLVLFFGAYLLSKFYVSQEVTFYSKIIKEVDLNSSNIDFVKTFGQEIPVMNVFDKLVWFDSFFRVRRDILMRIGFKIVFVVLIAISVYSHFVPASFLSFIGSTDIGERFLILFLFIYFPRALNEAVKVGLYLFPAKLGLFLTILRSSDSSTKDSRYEITDQILSFYSYKTKLFKEGPYHRDMRFIFVPGERALFVGPNLSGKSSLAKLFAGVTAYTPRAVKITVGEDRLEFSAWQKLCRSVYFFDPNFRTDRSLMECILGKITEEITMEEFSQALSIMNQYPSVVRLISPEGNYNISAQNVLSNPLQAFALHTLHCLVAPHCRLIIIDNFWVDLHYPLIREMIQILDRALPSSNMVVFSHDVDDSISYAHYYEFNKKIIRVR